MTLTSDTPRSRVSAHPAAPPAVAAQHFLGRLQFETDPSDVWTDIAAATAAFVLVDARSPEAFAAAHLPGALNLPHAQIDADIAAQLDPGRLHVTYCWGPACNASSRAAAALALLGFQVKELLGGLEAWQNEGFPVETGAAGRPPLSTQ
ncbi:MAG: rhodanese-like domain-containing protein [Actinomycetota bacterium]|nr:rhodanese-like domain-containing protein [Actinomycetota bacterium]